MCVHSGACVIMLLDLDKTTILLLQCTCSVVQCMYVN
jgi:hypothetical protein